MGILRNQAANDHEFVDAALTYARRGWSIIPTIGKRSAHHWKQFQTTPADEPTLRRLFSRKGITGLAVILGRASGGLACRDFDDADAYHRWADVQPELAAVLPTVRTARGFHVYFRGPDSFANLGNGEYRADAGHYCLLPPSRHPDGPTYTWQIMLPTGELPMVNPVSCGLLTQAHSGNGRVVDEILTLPPKQQLPTHLHPEQTQGKTHSHPPHTLHVSDDRVEAAIMATLPSGPGQRNRRLFDLARWLKSITPGAAMDSLEAIVRTWHAARPAVHHHKGLAHDLDRFSDGLGKGAEAGRPCDGRHRGHRQGTDANGLRRHRQIGDAVPSDAGGTTAPARIGHYHADWLEVRSALVMTRQRVCSRCWSSKGRSS